MKRAIQSRLIRNWKGAHRLWRVRLPLGLALVNGVYASWGAAQNHISPTLFIGLSATMSTVLCAGHLLKQPGGDNAGN